MTEPTDAELMDEAAKVGGLFDALALGYQEDNILGFARAVLAKWGTPPAVAGEPVGWVWQHEETGRTGFVDCWQVENGWQENNPRLRLVSKLYTSPPAVAPWRSAVLALIDECPGLTMEQDHWLSRRVKEMDFISAPQPTQAQAGAVPLTDAQSHALIERMANEAEQWAEGLSYEPTQEQLSGWCVAFIQREIHFAHGIKGGQHDI